MCSCLSYNVVIKIIARFLGGAQVFNTGFMVDYHSTCRGSESCFFCCLSLIALFQLLDSY